MESNQSYTSSSSLKLPNKIHRQRRNEAMLLFSAVATMTFLFVSFTLPLQDRFFSLLYPKPSSNAAPIPVMPLGEELREENTQLIAVLTQFNLQTGDIAAQLDEIKQRALVRRTKLIDLAQTRPRVILDNRLPEQLLQDLPTDVRDLFEQKIVVEGQTEVEYQSILGLPGQHRYYVIPPQGEKLQILLPQESFTIPVNSTLSMEGWVLGNTVSIENLETIDATLLPNPLAVGEKKVAIVQVDFNELTGAVVSAADIKRISGQVQQFFNTSSAGKMNMHGASGNDVDVVSSLRIDSSPLSCNPDEWVRVIESKEQPVSLSFVNYDRIVYVTPDVASCEWSIRASTKGTVWLNGVADALTIQRALAYSWGAGDSHGWKCSVPDGTSASECQQESFASPFDLMGNNGQGLNAVTLARFGWVRPTQLAVHSAIGDQRYELSSIDALRPNDNTQAVLLVSVGFNRNSSGLPQSYYHTEYRSDLNGVLIHRGSSRELGDGRTFLIDTHLNSETFNDAPLLVGETFEDPEQGISISFSSVENQKAVINVRSSAPYSLSWPVEIGVVCTNGSEPSGEFELVEVIHSDGQEIKTSLLPSDQFTHAVIRSKLENIRQLAVRSRTTDDYLVVSEPLPHPSMRIGGVGAPNNQSLSWVEKELPSTTEPYSLTFIAPQAQCR